MENKWDTEKIPDDYLTDYSLASHDRIFYIRKYRDKYVLSKVINNELEYFGTYDTKEEAVAQRTYLINHNWQMIQENNEKIDEHVYQVGDEYLVINQNEIYARFQDISEAIRCCVVLQQCVFDVINCVSTVFEKQDEDRDGDHGDDAGRAQPRRGAGERGGGGGHDGLLAIPVLSEVRGGGVGAPARTPRQARAAVASRGGACARPVSAVRRRA